MGQDPINHLNLATQLVIRLHGLAYCKLPVPLAGGAQARRRPDHASSATKAEPGEEKAPHEMTFFAWHDQDQLQHVGMLALLGFSRTFFHV